MSVFGMLEHVWPDWGGVTLLICLGEDPKIYPYFFEFPRIQANHTGRKKIKSPRFRRAY